MFNVKKLVQNSLAITALTLVSFHLTDVFAAQKSFLGTEVITSFSVDPTQPVQRGYLVPSAALAPGGATLTVDLYFTTLNTPVELYLQTVINDGAGNQRLVTLKPLSIGPVSDNPTLYHSKRQFQVDYAELDALLQKNAPGATNLKIGPGVPLFVYGKFITGTGAWSYHQWGGPERGGAVFMPDNPTQKNQIAVSATGASSRRPTELDLAFPITTIIANQFVSDVKTRDGLKVGGQVRSRVEAEGKYQIPLDQAVDVKKGLFEIANDPAKAAKLLGPDWTVKPFLRYMLKDPTDPLFKTDKDKARMLLDKNGLPMPDPMRDTYYDNANRDAAKKDIAIRYRFTEGNNFGSWNFKPGMDVVTPEGVVYRREYAVDTTNPKPETITPFANSQHPLNPFKMLTEVIPGAVPGEFFKPSVLVTDTRYKFELKHKSGVIVEISLDDVLATDLRGTKKAARYVQMEMDVDHLGLGSQNQVQAAAYGFLGHIDMAQVAPFMNALKNAAFFDGRPVLHDKSDLEVTSPVRTLHANDFNISTIAIKTLVEHLQGKNWIPGAQKYSLAATALGVVDAKDVSKSVKNLVEINEKDKLGNGSGASLFKASGSKCGLVF